MVYRYGVLPSQGVWFRREQEGAARRAGGGISRRQFAKLGAAAAAAAAIGTTGMFAYFTDEDSKANDLSVSPDLDIEVVEPSWVEEDARDMEPGQTVPKDPAVRNKSASAEGWVFLEVHVPMAEVVVYDPAAGTVSDASAKELFSYEADLSRWYLLKSFEALEGGVRTKVYRYAWPDVLKPGETTDPVFSEITLANLVNDQGQAGEHVVTAVGRGIQSYGFSTPEEAWAALGIVDDEYAEEPPHEQIDVATIRLSSAPGGSYAANSALKFYKHSEAPAVGQVVAVNATAGSGRVLSVVEDVEPMKAGDGASPLTDTPVAISCIDMSEKVIPEDMSYWFSGMPELYEVDLTGLDAQKMAEMDGTFSGSDIKPLLSNVGVDVCEATASTIVPDVFRQSRPFVVYIEKDGQVEMRFTLSTDVELSGGEYQGFSILETYGGEWTAWDLQQDSELWVWNWPYETGSGYCMDIWPSYDAAVAAGRLIPDASSLKGFNADGKFDALNESVKRVSFDRPMKFVEMGRWFAHTGDCAFDWANLDTSYLQIVNMTWACATGTDLDLSGLDLSSCKIAANAFRNASLSRLVLPAGLESSCQVATGMFQDASVGEVDLGGFSAANVVDMAYAFAGSDLAGFDFGALRPANLVYANSMFSQCAGLAGADLSGYDMSHVQTCEKMFYGRQFLGEVSAPSRIAGWDLSSCGNLSQMFFGACLPQDADYSSWSFCQAIDTADQMLSQAGIVTDYGYSKKLTPGVVGWGWEALATASIADYNPAATMQPLAEYLGDAFGVWNCPANWKTL